MSEYIYGKNVVREAINQKRNIEKIFFTDDKNPLIDDCKKNSIEFQIIPKDIRNKMVSGMHQGVIAAVEEYKYFPLEEIISNKKDALICVLDGLEDPHNLGAILRTCEAAKVDGIILPKNRSVRLNSTVAKVSTGAIELVKCVEVTNLTRTLKDLKEKGYWIVGAEIGNTSKIMWDQKYDMPIALIIGSEGKGISRLVKEECDFLVQIPMSGVINSLNASISAAILIYEIRRQQR